MIQSEKRWGGAMTAHRKVSTIISAEESTGDLEYIVEALKLDRAHRPLDGIGWLKSSIAHCKSRREGNFAEDFRFIEFDLQRHINELVQKEFSDQLADLGEDHTVHFLITPDGGLVREDTIELWEEEGERTFETPNLESDESVDSIMRNELSKEEN